MTLRFRSTETTPTASLLGQLRKMTTLSLGDLRARIAAGEPLFEITPFTGDWPEDRQRLVAITNDLAAGRLPLTVTDVHGDDESPVSPEMLCNLITHYRQIELETQRDTLLEMGEIESLDAFEPCDDNWTE